MTVTTHPFSPTETIMILTYESVARTIDHALLTPGMTRSELVAGCNLAARYEVASVCIKPYAVSLAIDILKDSAVKVGTVVGFPHGGQSQAIKLAEAIEAIDAGAREIDMVINIGAARGSEWDLVASEIEQLASAAHQRNALIKVILETCYLDEGQKIRLCQICSQIGVDYVKTSTGFGTAGATSADLILMRQHTASHVKVKASGGIKDLETAIRFIKLGCERLGSSRTAEILDELSARLDLPSRNVSRETTSNTEELTY